jgi:Transglycosylase SLT domain
MGAYDSTIVDAAQENNVDPGLALAVAQAESGGQQYDASGNVLTSSAGALGVMQLEPGTAAAYGADPTNPAENIDAGTAYLGDLINEYGDESTALAAYNWGPGNVSNAIAQYGTAPVVWQGYSVPAWFVHAPAATQNYVAGIMGASTFNGMAAGSGGVPVGVPSLPIGSPASLASALSLSPAAPSSAAPLASNLTPAAVLPELSDPTIWIIGGIAVAGLLVLLDVSNS